MGKIGNNTYASTDANGDLRIRLHSTDVVIRHADGSVTLDSGGWRTVTTKARMNEYAGVCRVYQKDFAWYVVAPLAGGEWDWDNPADFEDGMRLDRNGRPLTAQVQH